MLSNKPYLLRAFHQWIVDSECTPIVVLDALNPRCKIPQSYVDGGEIVFNVSPVAVRDFKISNDLIEFKAAFSHVVHIVSAPITAVLALYAEENNEGLFFDAADGDDVNNEMAVEQIYQGSIPLENNVTDHVIPKGRPVLTVVE